MHRSHKRTSLSWAVLSLFSLKIDRFRSQNQSWIQNILQPRKSTETSNLFISFPLISDIRILQVDLRLSGNGKSASLMLNRIYHNVPICNGHELMLCNIHMYIYICISIHIYIYNAIYVHLYNAKNIYIYILGDRSIYIPYSIKLFTLRYPMIHPWQHVWKVS